MVGYTLAFGPDVGARDRRARPSGSPGSARNRIPLAPTVPHTGVRVVPDDVRDHHAGADRRRVRRAGPLRRLPRRSSPRGRCSSTRRSRTGSGAAASSAPPAWARSTSPAARSSTSPPAPPRSPAAIFVGKRPGYPGGRFVPHNVPMVMLGAAILWFGWFGFNAGSALGAGGLAASAFVATHLGAAGAMIAWPVLERIRHGRATALGGATGAVAGLVAITPAAGLRGAVAGARDRARRRARLLPRRGAEAAPGVRRLPRRRRRAPRRRDRRRAADRRVRLPRGQPARRDGSLAQVGKQGPRGHRDARLLVRRHAGRSSRSSTRSSGSAYPRRPRRRGSTSPSTARAPTRGGSARGRRDGCRRG